MTLMKPYPKPLDNAQEISTKAEKSQYQIIAEILIVIEYVHSQKNGDEVSNLQIS